MRWCVGGKVSVHRYLLELTKWLPVVTLYFVIQMFQTPPPLSFLSSFIRIGRHSDEVRNISHTMRGLGEGGHCEAAAEDEMAFVDLCLHHLSSSSLGHATSMSSMLSICLCKKKVTRNEQNCKTTSFHLQNDGKVASEWRYLRVHVAVGAVPADVHLVLCGFLVDWIVKVDGVGVLQTPVSPQQHCSKDQQGEEHCRAGEELKVIQIACVTAQGRLCLTESCEELKSGTYLLAARRREQ